MNDTDVAPFDASRAELFEALSHPLRVRILQVLGERPQRFSALKHTLGLESSGHLAFHLEKLGALVKPARDGTYALSDEGRDALRLFTTLNPRNEAPPVHVAHKASFMTRNLVTVSLVLSIIVLSPFAVYGVNSYFQPETVQGVVLDKSTSSRLGEGAQYTQWYVLMLRLITKDSVNQYPVGEIHSYLFQGNTYDAIHVGDLITGIPDTTIKDVLDLIEITPFVKPPIINTGYIVHSNIGFSWSGALPWFSCTVHNLGEHSIVAIIVNLNQTFLPFSLGVSTTSPIPPSQIGQGFAPLRWYDADVKQVMDFTPVLGVKYPVTLTIIFDDDTVTTHTHMVNLTTLIPGVIAFLVTSDVHIDVDADLFMRGIHNGLFSLSLRNVWWNETISHITVLFADEHVIDTVTNIRTGNYWAGSSTLPLQVWTHLSYNVTIHIQTASGKRSTFTTMMFPQYLTS